jgi:hypothetical protein
MNRTLLHELALVFGGALLGVVSTDLIGMLPAGDPRTIVVTLLALALILYGFGTPQNTWIRIMRAARDRRWRRPRVGIIAGLNSTRGDGVDPIWTDITPEEWQEEIRKAALRRGILLKVPLIRAAQAFDAFDVILNPFGSTYPEANFRDFPIYQRLLAYIREGGLFVNVADIPTYFAYNGNLKRSIDRTPPLYTYSGEPLRFFTRVPLMEELAVRVGNYEMPTPPTVAVTAEPSYAACVPFPQTLVITRAAVVEGNVEPVFTPLDLGGNKVTPHFFCQYGDGRVLSSLSFLSEPFSSNRALLPLLADLTVYAIAGNRSRLGDEQGV